MKPVRIGNVEYKETAYIVPHDGNTSYEEIVVWYPNSYYGAEDRMKKEGWTFDEDGDAHRDNCHVSRECFKDKECCYCVATIEWNRAHDEYDIRSVGKRAFELSKEDNRSFMEILNIIDNSIRE